MMTETPVGMSPRQNALTKSASLAEEELAAARELVKAARDRGATLTGPDGLLKALTKTVLETALDEEMSEHLGYDKHAVAGRNGANSRNGKRTKTVLTDAAGEVEIEVPRDRDGTFALVIVAKRQRRLSDVDAVVLSLYAKGLTTGEISAHFAEVYAASVSKDTVSRITDRVLEDMAAWTSRPLLPVYAAVFIDALYVKVRDGQVANQPFYAAIGVDLAGRRDVLGLWAGAGGGESAKFWMSVLADLKNRGVRDIFFLVCDGLKGLPDSVNAVFPATIVQAWHHPPDPRHLPVRLQAVLGGDREGPAPDLHRRPDRGRGRRGPGVPGGEVGQGLPGDPPNVAGQLGAVHPVPGLRRRDPHGAVLDERDRA
jgi:putative transposase